MLASPGSVALQPVKRREETREKPLEVLDQFLITRGVVPGGPTKDDSDIGARNHRV